MNNSETNLDRKRVAAWREVADAEEGTGSKSARIDIKVLRRFCERVSELLDIEELADFAGEGDIVSRVHATLQAMREPAASKVLVGLPVGVKLETIIFKSYFAIDAPPGKPSQPWSVIANAIMAACQPVDERLVVLETQLTHMTEAAHAAITAGHQFMREIAELRKALGASPERDAVGLSGSSIRDVELCLMKHGEAPTRPDDKVSAVQVIERILAERDAAREQVRMLAEERKVLMEAFCKVERKFVELRDAESSGNDERS